MPKPPPVEFFEVTLRCPKELLGEVVSDFNRRGLTEVSFNLVTAVKAYKHNTVASRPEVSSQDFLAEWTKEHPTFKAIEAVHAFKADGRGHGTSAYHALTALVADGVLKKLADGMYSRADVKALPAPKKTKKAKRSPSVGRYDVDNSAFILRAARRNHGRINTVALRKLFEADGRPPSSVSPTLNALLKKKAIKRTGADGEGLYEIAKPKSKPGTKVPKAKATNGHATETAPAPGA